MTFEDAYNVIFNGRAKIDNLCATIVDDNVSDFDSFGSSDVNKRCNNVGFGGRGYNNGGDVGSVDLKGR